MLTKATRRSAEEARSVLDAGIGEDTNLESLLQIVVVPLGGENRTGTWVASA